MSPYTGRFSSRFRPKVRTRRKRQVLQRDGHRCAQCGGTQRLTVDHIVPACRAGSNRSHNLRSLCMRCNSRKSRSDRGEYAPAVVDLWRAIRLRDLLGFVAPEPPPLPVGTRYVLYGAEGLEFAADYVGHAKTGKLPTIVYFRAVAPFSDGEGP